MKAGCLTPDEIADLVRGIATPEQEHHLGACATCRRRVLLVRKIAAAGLAVIADRAAEVDALVDRFLATPRDSWWKAVREDEYKRADVARRLLALAMDARWKDRPRATALVKTATWIIDAVDSAEERDLRFEIWKNAATILRESGRYAELASAFTRAEQAAQRTAQPELAMAAMCLSRALFYAEPDIWQPEEAAALLDRAERVFAEWDETRMSAVRTARAFLLFRSGELARAAEVFGSLVAATSVTEGSPYFEALTNWLAVRVELREESSEIEELLEYLFEQFTRTGRTVHVAHVRWLIGRTHAIRGDYEAAVRLFREAMERIEDAHASLRIGLDAIEALLLADSFYAAYTLARDLASAAVALDRREPTRRHSLTTEVFAYLREAAQRQALTADLVTECARYLDRITRQRAVEFVPPMLLIEM
ncbi:MAG TPA: hypothetical protein VGD79_06435 [Thermoanaerobaculia bacterium]|jgi:tetratricopeptide (TPR) repeat protein